MWISVKQALVMLNGAIGKSLLYDLAKRKVIRSTRAGAKILIDANDLTRYLECNASVKVKTKSPPSVARLRGAKKKADQIELW